MANAGRVAIVPKGDYSSSTAYKRLDLVRYNERAYVAKKANTGISPTNTEYWMLMTSDGIVIDSALSGDSTNAVQNKVLKSALDSIQTTSRATLSTAGWYRVAEFNDESTNMGSFDLTIKKAWNYEYPEEHNIQYRNNQGRCKFSIINSIAYAQTLTKIRVVNDTTANKRFVEVYYNLNKSNAVVFVFTNIVNVSGDAAIATLHSWQAITPTLTSETVDGVTVTTTYDIPANASPVTDLDLAQFKGEALSTSIIEKALGLANGVHNFHLNGSSYTADDLPHKQYAYSSATIFKRNSTTISVVLWGQSGLNIAFNQYSSGVWTGWKTNVTAADLATALAGYLKNTGGKITGDLELTSDSAVTKSFRMENSVRDIYLQVLASGIFRIFDQTNNKVALTLGADGATNTFNGTATGNLANTGGGLSGDVFIQTDGKPAGYTLNDGSSDIALYVDGKGNCGIYDWKNGKWLLDKKGVAKGCLANTGGRLVGTSNAPLEVQSNDNAHCSIRYVASDGSTHGFIGFNNGNPVVFDSTGQIDYLLLHSGNIADYALAKDGGTINGGDNAVPVILSRTNGDYIELGFKGTSGTLGYLGFSSVNNPVFEDSSRNAFYPLLHTGNSAKVVQATTAPSDTTTVWIDITNKKTKAYIDGAWTVIA